MSSNIIHRQTEIIPAVMPVSLADLETRASRVVGLVHAVQIDVMDGYGFVVQIF
ncbi:MAG: hypothetical protein Q8R39_01640 [bacterium]|nr:hypothetical protein [bacterium]MDZ4285105.1 hypothetical protein [Patescibacteria group bacterium]